jgi:hypothetical protein
MIATHRWLCLTFSVILSTFCAIGTHATLARPLIVGASTAPIGLSASTHEDGRQIQCEETAFPPVNSSGAVSNAIPGGALFQPVVDRGEAAWLAQVV